MTYKDSAPFYDLFASENDVPYYKELGLQHGSALEIGIGTARVALELAKAGVEVWGIDNSPHMLNEAKKKLEKETESVQKRVELFEADMNNFNLDRKFPLVYIPSSTIQHCAEQVDQISCLKTINKHLSRTGLLAFNLILPSATYNNNLRFIGKVEHGDITIMRFISYQPNWQEQLLEVLLLFEIYKNGEMTKRIYDASTIAMISKREIVLLLEKTGFKIKNLYGDYNKSKKVVNQMVIEARKV
ncbi:MAG: class I SAM-dependent methyltransferase [Candidatus Bathyarchaeota archaeon]|nr:class I SAM-dependent methyltransferase [Candidatus Bathyarchaeota archaeon]MDH5494081.1 class I SAM-dependent methyltransferase [Candidatus Bathyarchaeota archaeon]